MEINADFIGTDISLKIISMAKNNLNNDKEELLVADGFNLL
jgi:hypothetical protein